MGTIKSVGRIYQQTFLDTYTKVAFAKLYDRKNALVAADMLNDRVLAVLRGAESSIAARARRSRYRILWAAGASRIPVVPAVENIEHSRTKARHPQTNGICEHFHRTIQEEFYATAFRNKLYQSLDELQTDLDDWLRSTI